MGREKRGKRPGLEPVCVVITVLDVGAARADRRLAFFAVKTQRLAWKNANVFEFARPVKAHLYSEGASISKADLHVLTG